MAYTPWPAAASIIRLITSVARVDRVKDSVARIPHWGQRALQRSVIWITTCPGTRLLRMDLKTSLNAFTFSLGLRWRDF
jgi:hypothetical protein